MQETDTGAVGSAKQPSQASKELTARVSAAAAAAIKAYNDGWGYADEGVAEHKGGKHLEEFWHKGYGGLRVEGEDYAEEEERLHELEAHVRLGLVVEQAVAAAAAAVKAYNEGWGYADKGIAEHKEAKGHLAPYWRKSFKESKEDYKAKEERLHELEEHVRLGLAAQEAVSAAAAAVKAYGESWGYAYDGVAEHKEAKGHLAQYWGKGFKEANEDYEDEEARLHELEKTVRQDVAARVAAAANAVKAYNDGWGYADKGTAEHKSGRLLPYWRKGFNEENEDYEDEESRLHELEEHVRRGVEASEALLAAIAAMAAYNEGWGYADKGTAEHKSGKGHLASYWRKSFKEPNEDYEDEEARLHELEEHEEARLHELEEQAAAAKPSKTEI